MYAHIQYMNFSVCVCYAGLVVIIISCHGCPQIELIEKGGDGKPQRLRVEYKSNETGEVSSEEFNTVSICLCVCLLTKLLKSSSSLLSMCV